MTRPEHHWEDQAVLSTIEIMLDRNVSLTNLARSGLDTAQVPYLQRDERRIQSCLDWLEPLATPEGFAPGMFSIMDVNLIAAFTSMESRKPGQWKGRPSLEAIYERYQTRPSVADTFPPPA
jgi:glutathione S-transferase